jgi:hypothetical protein
VQLAVIIHKNKKHINKINRLKKINESVKRPFPPPHSFFLSSLFALSFFHLSYMTNLQSFARRVPLLLRRRRGDGSAVSSGHGRNGIELRRVLPHS